MESVILKIVVRKILLIACFQSIPLQVLICKASVSPENFKNKSDCYFVQGVLCGLPGNIVSMRIVLRVQFYDCKF